MRPFTLALGIAALLVCSKAAGPVIDSAVVEPPQGPALAAPRASGARDAGAAESVHVIRLPDQLFDDTWSTDRTIDIAAGDLPGPAFPAGTVYVATTDAKTPTDPVAVTEWDLARATIVRSIVLPVLVDEVTPRILRVGDDLRVLVSSQKSVSFVQLTRDLRVERHERWAGHVLSPGIDAFSADANLTAALYFGDARRLPGDNDGAVLATFDASGRRVAMRTVQRDDPHDLILLGLEGNAVVLDGRVFYLRCSYLGDELLALTPDLRIVKRVLVSTDGCATADLHAREGRVQVDSGYPARRAVEFSTDLERLGPTASAGDPPKMKLGDVTVDVCVHNGHGWLAWSTTAVDLCASSPAYLRDAPPAGCTLLDPGCVIF
jgi:hypothetical protein